MAEQRRAIPAGGEVADDYRFVAEDGTQPSLADRFASWSTATCSGRPVKRPARCVRRSWAAPGDVDARPTRSSPRRDGVITQFGSDEVGGEMADPGQDPRGAVELDPLWLLLDTTPGGRGGDWHPQLSY